MDKTINTAIFIGIITIIVIILTWYKALKYNNKNLENIKWTESDATTHIIVTRYKEESIIKMLLPIINKKNVSIFIYNKGDEINEEEFEGINNIEIIKIRNIGWDSYPYIKHVIDNYNNFIDQLKIIFKDENTIIILNKNFSLSNNEKINKCKIFNNKINEIDFHSFYANKIKIFSHKDENTKE